MEVPGDPAVSGYDHVGKGLRRSDLDPNPVRQFANWFTAAIEASIRDVNAMSLATAGRDARPSVRIVLLKSFDQDGFVFFSNYESAKGKQLDANPYAALGFYWIELDRQVRVSGKVEKTSREESQAYSIRVLWEASWAPGPRARAKSSTLVACSMRAWQRSLS